MSWSHLSLSWQITPESNLYGVELHEITKLVEPLLPSNWELAEIEVNGLNDNSLRFYIHDRIKEDDLLAVGNALKAIQVQNDMFNEDEKEHDGLFGAMDVTEQIPASELNSDLTQAERQFLFGTTDDKKIKDICESISVKCIERPLTTICQVTVWRSWLPPHWLRSLCEWEAQQNLKP